MTELQASRAKSGEYSKELVDEVVDRKIEELFELLDSDRDGLLSAVRVNIDALTKARLAIVAPLLAEMEEKRATLDFEGFSQAIHRLLAILNVHDRRVLLDMKGRQRSSIGDMIDLPFKVGQHHAAAHQPQVTSAGCGDKEQRRCLRHQEPSANHARIEGQRRSRAG